MNVQKQTILVQCGYIFLYFFNYCNHLSFGFSRYYFRSCGEILHRMKDLCRYINNFDDEGHRKYKHQVVYSTLLVFFKNAFQYVGSIQPSLFQGRNCKGNNIVADRSKLVCFYLQEFPYQFYLYVDVGRKVWNGTRKDVYRYYDFLI